MSWDASDGPVVEQLKVDMASLRSSIYLVTRTVNQISHKEKKAILLSALRDIEDNLYTLELTLQR